MDFIRPFGPSIGHAQLPQDLIDDFNVLCDELTTPEEFAEHDYTDHLLTDIKLNVEIPDNVLKQGKHAHTLLSLAQEYIEKGTGHSMQLRINDGWINRWVDKHEHMPAHIHGHSYLSMIGYLRAPDNLQELLDVPGKHCGSTQFRYGEVHDMGNSGFNVVSDPGLAIFFPSWLETKSR